MTQYASPASLPTSRAKSDDTAGTAVNFGLDRVRWGPIIAGLFVALSTLAVLSVLGIAVGLSNVDRGDTVSGFGIGAGIWGAVSALIAFFVGGLVSSRNAATPVVDVTRQGHLHPKNGMLQGAMVWAVAIPLSTYFAASVASSAVNTAGAAASTGLQTTATLAQNSVDQPDAISRVAGADNGREAVGQTRKEADNASQQAGEAARAAGDQLQGAKQSVQNAMTPDNVERAAGYGAKASWGLLGSMLLGLVAAIAGGMVGGNSRPAGATA